MIKQAYAAKYLNHVETWLKMSGDRNLVSHTYDFQVFEDTLAALRKEYLPVLEECYLNLLQEV